jgi:hypothetical protein
LEATCQRCHETLREADRYCPVCGLPQLIYLAAEAPVVTLGSEAAPLPGLASEQFGLPDGIAWRPALKTALMLAVPAGLLCAALGQIGQSMALGLVWMMGAAAWAVSLYTKRARSGRLSIAEGARIGLVTGLLASWLAVGVDGVSLWVGRFAMHQGSQMDSRWSTRVDQSMQLSQQMIAQMGMANAQSTQFAQSWRALELSVEGRAGFALSDTITGAAFLILFAIIGGAVGARFLAQPRRPNA